jgi:hypothetical protein
MKKLFFLAILIAILAAFFASTHPDGLDFVAEQFGFAGKGIENAAPMPGYSLKFIPQGSLSTSLAGIAGILIILAIFRLIGIWFRGLLGYWIIGICLIVTWFNLSPALAARPLITDDFYTVAQGGYELEVGYASTQNQDSLANTAGLSFKRGFLSNFDLGIEVPYTTSAPSGLNDILLHAKYRFWEADENAGLTARIDFKFKNADSSQGLGSGDNDYWLVLIGSKMFGETKTHLNIGYVNVGFNAGRSEDDYWAYTFALEHPVWGEKGDLVAECVANTALTPNPIFIQLGGRYVVFEGFKLDAAYSFGLNSNSIKNSLTAGFHYEF